MQRALGTAYCIQCRIYFRVLREIAGFNSLINAAKVLVQDASGSSIMWPTSELPICPAGSPTSSPEPEIKVCGRVAHSASPGWGMSLGNGVVGGVLAVAETIENDQQTDLGHVRSSKAICDW